MIIIILILFILFIIIAEYIVVKNNNSKPPKKEHWTNYKSIVNKGRCSQNIARVIPMYNIALDPMKPSNKQFNWTKYFDGSKFKQEPVNIAFHKY